MKVGISIEKLPLDGIIRWGDEHDRFGKPYKMAAGYRFLDNTVEIVAFAIPEQVGLRSLISDFFIGLVGLIKSLFGKKQQSIFRPAHAKAVTSALKNEFNRDVVWDRYGSDGKHKRRIVVAKEKILPISAGYNHDGSINEEAVIAEVRHAFAQAREGHYKISMGESEVVPGHIRIVIDRIETNHNVPAA